MTWLIKCLLCKHDNQSLDTRHSEKSVRGIISINLALGKEKQVDTWSLLTRQASLTYEFQVQ